MTAASTSDNSTLAWLVGDRVRVQPGGQLMPGRITSIHRLRGGIEYVVRTDPAVGGIGQVLNIWTASGNSSFLTAQATPRSGRAR
jgi:hypothetical protein